MVAMPIRPKKQLSILGKYLYIFGLVLVPMCPRRWVLSVSSMTMYKEYLGGKT